MNLLLAALHPFNPQSSIAMTPRRQRMREDMSSRNRAQNTQHSYLQQISCYAKHFHRSPEVLGPEDVRAHQVYVMLSPAARCAARVLET